MPVNTGYLESTPAVFSAISLNGSGYTGFASTGTITASNVSVANLVFVAGSLNLAAAQAPSPTLYNASPSLLTAGTALLPSLSIGFSEQSLGFYRSAASQIALSYGFLSAPQFISSQSTNQSAASAKIPNQGQIVFSILSLTTNGAAMYYRSGNSVFGWPSSLAVG